MVDRSDWDRAMNNLGVALRELVGLFVDDGSLATSIIVWVVCCVAGKRILDIPPPWIGISLAFGLAGILLENAWRGARGLRRDRARGARVG